MNKLSKQDIRQALWHEEFRKLFPDLKKEIETFLHKPGCLCNAALYNKILKYPDKLKEYFPTKEIVEIEKEEPSSWKVINCNISELERKLKRLGSGQKYVTMARYQDQITVVISQHH